MASIAMDTSDDYIEVEDYDYIEEEEDSHDEYVRLGDFVAFALRVNLTAYTLADLMRARDAVASTAGIIPRVGVVGASDDSDRLAGVVAEALKTAEAPSDGRDCPICLQDDDGTAAWKETPCRHRFHGRCVEKWLQAKGSCPMCRSQVVTMPAAAANSVALESDWQVISDLYGQVIAYASMEEE